MSKTDTAQTVMKLAFVGCCLTSLGAVVQLARHQIFKPKQEFKKL